MISHTVCVWMCACVCACVRACMRACMCKCMRACVRACVCPHLSLVMCICLNSMIQCNGCKKLHNLDCSCLDFHYVDLTIMQIVLAITYCFLKHYGSDNFLTNCPLECITHLKSVPVTCHVDV